MTPKSRNGKRAPSGGSIRMVESSEAWDPGVLASALDKHKGLGQRDDVLSGPTSVPPKVQDFLPTSEELGILSKR